MYADYLLVYSKQYLVKTTKVCDEDFGRSNDRELEELKWTILI